MNRVVEEKKNDNKIKVYIVHMYNYIPIRRTDALSLEEALTRFLAGMSARCIRFHTEGGVGPP